jgi:hypothetical protein
MGIAITIGEAGLRYDADDDESLISGRAVRQTRPDAPACGGDAPHGNVRSFSYGGFSAWLEAAGLTALFYDKHRGLAREHPGCVLLRPEHLAAIRAAVQRPHPEPRHEWLHYAETLAWLEWWTAWALANCKVPAIYNS